MNPTPLPPSHRIDYDEERVLDRYIFTNYRRLLMRAEEWAVFSMPARVDVGSVRSVDMLPEHRNTWLLEADPHVVAALESARLDPGCEPKREYLRRIIRDRVLRDHGPQIFINRCPACSRIVRSPVATDCIWCDYVWG